MDFDITHLSPNARKRIRRYVYKSHLSKVFWGIPLVALVFGIFVTYYVDQVSNHDLVALIVICIIAFVFFSGYFLWILKKEPCALNKFKDDFINDRVFPICFECNKGNPDKLEKCSFCGACLKIKLLPESFPNGILSFNNMLNVKLVNYPIGSAACGGLAFSLLLPLLNFVPLFLFQYEIQYELESINKFRIAYLECKSDINDGIIRYLIPRPGSVSISDSGKFLNGVPVFYNHYDKTDVGIKAFGITMKDSGKNLAIDHAVNYNRGMSKAINCKGFINKNSASMVMLKAPCSCIQQCSHAKIMIFPKCFFDQKVIVKLQGNPDSKGTVCGIEVDKAGKITYAVRAASQTVYKGIAEDNLTIIKEP
jgi:hypothetical protein